jgi:hypothetical protein
MLLNSVTCRPNIDFDHLFDDQHLRLVRLHLHLRLVSPFPTTIGTLEGAHPGVKALRRWECLGDCFRELCQVGNGQHDLYNERWVRKVEFCKLCDLYVLGKVSLAFGRHSAQQ